MHDVFSGARQVRARLTTPSSREVEPEVRGFYGWSEGPTIVRPVGLSFLAGYRIGMEQPGAVGVMRQLQDLPRQWQGFAAEGAGMSVAIRSRLEPWHRDEFHKLVSTSGGRHSYMMHVGLGWALARLPQFTWPDLSQFDPAVAPLILDGYGFHEVFFHTEATLGVRGPLFPWKRWPGGREDAEQQVMQGIGRGCWFVGGGDPVVVHDMIDSFESRYRSSMWAGVGLAATYAGGRSAAGLRELVDRAGDDACWLRQGCAFATEARHRASTLTRHTALAAEVLCGRTVEDLVGVCAAVRPSAQESDSGNLSMYEQWRASIAKELSAPARRNIKVA